MDEGIKLFGRHSEGLLAPHTYTNIYRAIYRFTLRRWVTMECHTFICQQHSAHDIIMPKYVYI